MPRQKRTRWLMALSIFILLGCGNKLDPVQIRDVALGDISGPVTYTKDIKPVLEKYCTSCHSTQAQGDARKGAPISVNFDTYVDAKANGKLGNALLQTGAMPVGGPEVSDQEKSLFQLWIDQDMPE